MDKIDFITRQLKRTHKKRFENYVLTRVWHGIDSFDVKMITQQYVMRENGCALLDAYFPQFNIGIEVDEYQHKIDTNIELDNRRERDVITAIGCRIYRVDVTQDISDIHIQCDQIIEIIKQESNKALFEAWNINDDYKSSKYIEKGYIAVDENVAFRKQVDALECFGIYYKSSWTGGENHPIEADVHIWFPKMHARKEWINTFDANEETIFEKNENSSKNEETIKKWLADERVKRYVFVYSKDSLGMVLYRFKGVFELDKDETIKLGYAVWRKKGDRVLTTCKVLKGAKH